MPGGSDTIPHPDDDIVTTIRRNVRRYLRWTLASPLHRLAGFGVPLSF